jgi:DNA-binding response OmpR family regulator
VKGAQSSQDGLEAIKAEKPDILLLDLMMPDMDGWEVYQKLKADPETENIPVIVITAKAQNIDKVLGLKIAGVDDYICKPFHPQDLVDSIRRVLEKNPA